MRSLDVIMPTKNSGDIIRECLTALRSQTIEARACRAVGYVDGLLRW